MIFLVLSQIMLFFNFVTYFKPYFNMYNCNKEDPVFRCWCFQSTMFNIFFTNQLKKDKNKCYVRLHLDTCMLYMHIQCLSKEMHMLILNHLQSTTINSWHVDHFQSLHRIYLLQEAHKNPCIWCMLLLISIVTGPTCISQLAGHRKLIFNNSIR